MCTWTPSLPSLLARPAEAAAERLEIDVGAAVARIGAGEHRRGVRAVRRGDRKLRDRRRECGDDHVDDALADMRARRGRGGKAAIHQRAGLGDDLVGVEDALVVRHVGIEQGFERVRHRGLGGVRRVDVARHLLGRTGEVERHAALADGDPALDRQVARGKAVIVHHVLGGIDALGDGGEARAHPRLGARDDLVEGRLEHVRTVALRQLVHAPLAGAAGRDLREVVAAPLVGNALVDQQQREDVLHQLAAAEEMDDRDAQAFLVDLGHAAGHRARRHAAHVGVMRDVRHVADQPAG
jgi:hypothetical protein